MRALAGSLGLFVVSACTGVTGGTGGHCPLPATITADNFADAVGTAVVCATTFCAPIAAGLLPAAEASPFVADYKAAYAAALSHGTLSVDFPRAGACLAALSNGCRADLSVHPTPAACVGVLVPKASIGDVCYTGYDCISGICDGPSNVGGCPGTCKAVGHGCTQSYDCGTWQICSKADCIAGVGAGESCAEDQDCGIGLACTAGSCASPGNAGKACSSDIGCTDGLFCNFEPIDAGLGKCTPTLATGQPCPPESYIECGYGAYCDWPESMSDPKCVPYGAVGDACLMQQGDEVFVVCQAGLNCLDGGCVLPPASGPCEQGACALGSYCDGTQSCVPLKPNGQACDLGPVEDWGCQSADCNDAGVCVPTGTYCPIENL